MTLRHLKLTVSAHGHRTQTIVLVTTLLDPIADPAHELGGGAYIPQAYLPEGRRYDDPTENGFEK